MLNPFKIISKFIRSDNQKNLDNEFLMYVIEQIGLDDFVYQKAGLLSHGQKQWLEIGML